MFVCYSNQIIIKSSWKL